MKNAIGFKTEIAVSDKTVRDMAKLVVEDLLYGTYTKTTMKAAGYANRKAMVDQLVNDPTFLPCLGRVIQDLTQHQEVPICNGLMYDHRPASLTKMDDRMYAIQVAAEQAESEKENQKEIEEARKLLEKAGYQVTL